MPDMHARQRFFNNLVPEWDAQYKESGARVLKICQTLLPSVQVPLLDLGSGTGVLLPVFGQLGLQHNQVYEVDIASDMLATARDRHPGMAGGFVLADGAQLPIRPASVAMVFCFQVFPHFSNKAAALRDIYSTLWPGGEVIILHLLDHNGLNALHAAAGNVVGKDRILPANKVAVMAKQIGFEIEICCEQPDLYLLLLRKPLKQ